MKYTVETPNTAVGVDSWRSAVIFAKANQPSSIWRGKWCITRFPWPGEIKVVGSGGGKDVG